jgi:predicted amidohydrolase YtcJ
VRCRGIFRSTKSASVTETKQVKLFADGAIYFLLMQVRNPCLDGNTGEWMMDKDVFERAFRVYRDAGYQIHIHVNGDEGLNRSWSLHSDMPMAPADPLFLMWCAVNRLTTSGRVAGPDQRVTAEMAFRGGTIEAAYSLKLEDEIGTISPGKRANFTILDANPFSVDSMDIRTIGVWGTVMEGRLLPVGEVERKASLAQAQTETPQPANPAAVYCVETGGTYKILKEEAGERGICVLPDGSEVDAWEHFRAHQGALPVTAADRGIA